MLLELPFLFCTFENATKCIIKNILSGKVLIRIAKKSIDNCITLKKLKPVSNIPVALKILNKSRTYFKTSKYSLFYNLSEVSFAAKC